MSKNVQVAAPSIEKADEEFIALVLAAMADESQKAKTIPDWLVSVGVTNPFQLTSVRKLLRGPLSRDGAHFRLTQNRRWIRTTERWAEEYGLEKGKTEGDFRAQVPSVEVVRQQLAGADVPAAMRESADTALSVLSDRANRKLDRATLDLAAEQVQTVVAKGEEIMRENRQLREYADDTRRTKDQLLVLLDRLTAHMPGSGLAVAPEEGRANGAARFPTQQ